MSERNSDPAGGSADDPAAYSGRAPRERSRRRPDPSEEVLYAEDGWSWAWVLAGPAFCLAAGIFESATGAPVHWLMLAVCAVAIALTHGVMIAATRIHGLVRITESTLWQGTEDLPLSLIEGVLPEPIDGTRLLGELSGVPRRRFEVGIKLHGGSLVRAYARHPAEYVEVLESLVGTATPPSEREGIHDDDGPDV